MQGGFLDPEPNLFGIDTMEEAARIKSELENYCEEKSIKASFVIERYDFE